MGYERCMDNSDLLDCPFCGGTACGYFTVKNVWAIECEICGASIEDSTISSVKKLWNSRVDERKE